MKCIEWTGSRLSNQQATANHTAKMFNNSVIRGMLNLNQKETKMTRNEAKRKLVGTTNRDYNPDDILNILEALGLIKFDEERKPAKTPEEIIGGYTIYTSSILEHLEYYGYKIVKK